MYTIIQIEEIIKEKMLQTMEVGILIIMFKTLHGLEEGETPPFGTQYSGGF